MAILRLFLHAWPRTRCSAAASAELAGYNLQWQFIEERFPRATGAHGCDLSLAQLHLLGTPRLGCENPMASFVPYHGKKKDRLGKLENDLRRLLQAGADSEPLLAAALTVRDGRIRVLRAKQNQNPERNARERAVFLKHGAQIAALQNTSAEAILADFVRENPSDHP